MPSIQAMRQNMKRQESIKKRQMIQELSNNQKAVEGIMYVNELQRKQEKEDQKQANPVKSYVDHFSHVADVFSVDNEKGGHNAAFDFASLMKNRMTTNSNKHLSD